MAFLKGPAWAALGPRVETVHAQELREISTFGGQNIPGWVLGVFWSVLGVLWGCSRDVPGAFPEGSGGAEFTETHGW